MIDGRVTERAWSLSIPMSAYFELTYACNWRCVFCYNPRHNDLRRLSATEWTAVLDSLRRLGTLNLTLTGGEPLAYPGFFDVATAARERSFALRIFTNGALIDAEAAGRIASYDPLSVELSLHGASAAVHDATTATPGSFDAMWRGVDLLLQRNVRIVLKTPVTLLNERELDAILQLCERRGIPLRLDANITPRDDGEMSPLQFSASVETRRRVMRMAVREGAIGQLVRSAGQANCGVGRVTVAVDPEGNVYPCMQWRHRAMGNVRDDSLEQIWTGPDERPAVLRASIEANHSVRALGSEAEAYPFCPALAVARTGSPTRPDAGYLENAAMARELLNGS